MKNKKFKYDTRYYNVNSSVLFYNGIMLEEIDKLGQESWQVVSVTLNGEIIEMLIMKEYYDE